MTDVEMAQAVLVTLEQHGTPVAYTHVPRQLGKREPMVARRILTYVELTRYHGDTVTLRAALRLLDEAGTIEWRANGDVLTTTTNP
jgi:hypothetical protein